MEPTTLLYALIGAAGLLGADAYLNSSTIHLQTSVAPIYEQRGFSSGVVEAIFAGELDKIADTGSVIGELNLVTSKDKPVSSALAGVAGLSEALHAAQTTVGLKHTVLLASIVADSKDGKDIPRIIVTGTSHDARHFDLTVALSPETMLDKALAEAAFLAMKEINPYIAALYAFEKAEVDGVHPTQARILIEEWLAKAPTAVHSSERALFENLLGLSLLIDNDPASAEKWFLRAHGSDPGLAPARLNVAFMALHRGDHARAAELAGPLVESWTGWLSSEDKITYPTHVLLGIAFAGLGKSETSDEHFERAIAISPSGVGGYFYWARELLKRGRTVESEAIMGTARRNVPKLTNYPELTAQYFWLPDSAQGTLQKRTKTLPELKPPGYVRREL